MIDRRKGCEELQGARFYYQHSRGDVIEVNRRSGVERRKHEARIHEMHGIFYYSVGTFVGKERRAKPEGK